MNVSERALAADKLISKFEDFASLRKFAETTLDNELLGKIKIVLAYTHNLPSLINGITRKTTPHIQTAGTFVRPVAACVSPGSASTPAMARRRLC